MLTVSARQRICEKSMRIRIIQNLFCSVNDDGSSIRRTLVNYTVNGTVFTEELSESYPSYFCGHFDHLIVADVHSHVVVDRLIGCQSISDLGTAKTEPHLGYRTLEVHITSVTLCVLFLWCKLTKVLAY